MHKQLGGRRSPPNQCELSDSSGEGEDNTDQVLQASLDATRLQMPGSASGATPKTRSQKAAWPVPSDVPLPRPGCTVTDMQNEEAEPIQVLVSKSKTRLNAFNRNVTAVRKGVDVLLNPEVSNKEHALASLKVAFSFLSNDYKGYKETHERLVKLAAEAKYLIWPENELVYNCLIDERYALIRSEVESTIKTAEMSLSDKTAAPSGKNTDRHDTGNLV